MKKIKTYSLLITTNEIELIIEALSFLDEIAINNEFEKHLEIQELVADLKEYTK